MRVFSSRLLLPILFLHENPFSSCSAYVLLTHYIYNRRANFGARIVSWVTVSNIIKCYFKMLPLLLLLLLHTFKLEGHLTEVLNQVTRWNRPLGVDEENLNGSNRVKHRKYMIVLQYYTVFLTF